MCLMNQTWLREAKRIEFGDYRMRGVLVEVDQPGVPDVPVSVGEVVLVTGTRGSPEIYYVIDEIVRKTVSRRGKDAVLCRVHLK